MSQDRAQNTFQKGLNADTSNYQTPNNLYTYLENGTYITYNGDEFILQNEKGTEYKASIKENYIPLAIKSFGNVAYIISAEAIYKEQQNDCEGCTPYYKETFGQHILRNISAGSYTLSFTSDSDFIISINTSIDGTLISKQSVSSGQEFSLSVNYTENFDIKTNKTGVETQLIVKKNNVKKVFAGLTGKGEIGSFPSPDYSSIQQLDENTLKTNLINEYKPFYNYKGDNDTPINTLSFFNEQLGEFNSEFFNFNVEHPVEIVSIQPSFDKSVNVLFTDGFNRPRLINSRFSVISDSNVRVIDRIGTSDANVYEESDWETQLNQILSTNTLPFVRFDDQKGGNLSVGNYKYFFVYSTQDRNISQVIAETNPIPVFIGNKVSTTRGDVENTPSNKSNVFTLLNLDKSYSFIRVYYAYDSSQEGIDSVSELYEIDKDYTIEPNGTCFIEHTGFEANLVQTQETINQRLNNIFTYKTGCELKGRIFSGNITTKTYDRTVLEEFSKNIRIYEKETEIEIPSNLNSGYPSTINETIDYTRGYNGTTYESVTYRGGYYNPKNVHNYLGYWDAETYCFAVEYFFKDGSSSNLYPIRGIDNINGNAVYTGADVEFDNATGENTKGIYRFSRKESGLVESEIFTRITEVTSKISTDVTKIKSPLFNIPDNKDFIIEQGIIGLRFHRTKRKINSIGQGIMFDIVPVPTFDSDYVNDSGVPFLRDYDFENNTLKKIPAFDLIVEGVAGSLNDNTKENQTVGMRLESYNGLNGFSKIQEQISKNQAFISPEFIINKNKTNNRFNLSEATIDIINKVDYKFVIQTKAKSNSSNSSLLTDYFSLISPKNYNPVSKKIEEVKTDFVDSVTDTLSTNSFSTNFQNVSNYGFNIGFITPVDIRISVKYNDYVGITFNQDTQIQEKLGEVFGNKPIEIEFGDIKERQNPKRKAYIVNIYPDGVFETEKLNSLYSPNTELYTPITQKLYLSNKVAEDNGASLINKERDYVSIFNVSFLDILFRDLIDKAKVITSLERYTFSNGENTGVIAYGGDCYVNPIYRKLFFSSLDEKPVVDEQGGYTEERKNALGYTIQFHAQSNYNIAGRYNEIFNIQESKERTYAPLNVSQSPNFFIDPQNKNNPWRNTRLPESAAYNTGYHSRSESRSYVAEDINLPFIQNTFNTSIFFTNVYTQGAFENGYRSYNLLANQNYPQNLGEIVALRPHKQTNNLVCVHEYGVTIIPVNERIAQSGDTAGGVFFDDIQVLADPKNILYVSENIGSQWRDSVKSSDNFVYGVDTNSSKIWSLVGNQLEFISDFKIQSVLNKLKEKYSQGEETIFYKEVKTFYDRNKQSMHFVFRSPDIIIEEIPPELTCPTYEIINNKVIVKASLIEFDPNKTAIFNESSLTHLVYNEIPSKMWQTYHTYHPSEMFSIHNKVFSFNIINNNNKLYQHYSSDKFSYYYDEQHDFVVEFVVSKGTQFQHIYDNLMLIGNQAYPYKIEYTTDSQFITQLIRPEATNKPGDKGYQEEPINSIVDYNAAYKEDHLYIVIQGEQEDINIIDYLNRRVRDKYCKIRIFYNTSDKVMLQSVLTTIRRSNG